jgi:hypothetical protein
MSLESYLVLLLSVKSSVAELEAEPVVRQAGAGAAQKWTGSATLELKRFTYLVTEDHRGFAFTLCGSIMPQNLSQRQIKCYF